MITILLLGAQSQSLLLPQVYAAPVCYIFDLVTNDDATKAALISVVKGVLENGGKMKLMHDCRRPVAALRYQLHIQLSNVFDPQASSTSHCT